MKQGRNVLPETTYLLSMAIPAGFFASHAMGEVSDEN